MKRLVICFLGVFMLVFILLSNAWAQGEFTQTPQQSPRIQRQRELPEGEAIRDPIKEQKETMMQQMREEDPEIQELNQKVSELMQKAKELAKKYNTASSSEEQSTIKTEIQITLNKAFDLKLQIEEKRLNHLREKLKELEQISQTRKSNKKEIVEQHLNNLLKEKDYLKW